MFDGQFYPFQPIQFMDGLLFPIIGFGDRGAAALVDRTTGTNIGNGINGGGLAASFDGNTSQDNTVCTIKNAVGANSMYVGKTTAVPTAIESVLAHGTNVQGFTQGPAGPTVTITLYGKTGAAPANGTDGTSLGSVVFADTQNESAGRTITSSDTATYWDHVWVNITQANNVNVYMAELQMTGWIV